jgi:hypothetical protein
MRDVSEAYLYQPESRSCDYEQGVAILQSKHPLVKAGWVDPTPHLDEISRRIQSSGVSLQPLKANVSQFHDYFDTAGYQLRYPDYYRNNLPEKAFEHFIAVQLLNPGPSDIFIDVASEGSPLPDIVKRLYGSAAYAQDIMYEPGICGNRIGGDACHMPVPDGFATCATLTCSLEHFEGDGDTQLFRELCRVLRAGSRVVVVPLYMFHEPAIQTDPTYSATIEVPFDPGATLYCAKDWCNRHGRFYSPETLRARLMASAPEMRFTVYRLLGTEAVDEGIYARFVLKAERL